jgi:hypothetical protein
VSKRISIDVEMNATLNNLSVRKAGLVLTGILLILFGAHVWRDVSRLSWKKPS